MPTTNEHLSSLVLSVVDGPARSGRLTLDEIESRQIISSLGIPTCIPSLVRSREDAVAIAGEFQSPVSLKIVSADIPHKSAHGCVALSVTGPDEVRIAYEKIWDHALAVTSADRIRGVAIEPMAVPGLETFLGLTRDPLFGAVVVFGIGGVFVETLGDTAMRLPPLSDADIDSMITELRGRSLILGDERSHQHRDVSAIKTAIQRLIELVPMECIESVDINPLLVYPEGEGTRAVDGSIVLNQAFVDEATLRP